MSSLSIELKLFSIPLTAVVNNLLLPGYFVGAESPQYISKVIVVVKTERPLPAAFLVTCTDFYMIFIKEDQPYIWLDFSMGDEVPENSPQIGVFTTGEPIYLVRKSLGGTMCYSYYVSGESVVYFRDNMGWKNEQLTVEMLVLL